MSFSTGVRRENLSGPPLPGPSNSLLAHSTIEMPESNTNVRHSLANQGVVLAESVARDLQRGVGHLFTQT
jgi:hypothetical protein